jgi:hypothetical protein
MKPMIGSSISKPALIAVCSLFVFGCSSNSSKKLQAVESLDGRWENGCQNNGINSPFTRYRYDVTQDAFELFVTRYADPQCASAIYQVAYSGTIINRELEALSNDPGSVAAAIDVRFDGVSMTTLSQEQLSIHQASALCGITDWQINVSYDVVGCSFVPLSNVPYEEYNVYSVSETDSNESATHAIYFGALSGASADDRSTEVDLGNPYYGNLF